MKLQKNCSFDHIMLGECLTLRLYGEIDHHSAVRIRTEIDQLIREKMPGRVLLDLKGIEFMDSSGLGLIMGRYSLMQKLGGELSVKNPNERIVRIFELAGLSRMVKMEWNESEVSK